MHNAQALAQTDPTKKRKTKKTPSHPTRPRPRHHPPRSLGRTEDAYTRNGHLTWCPPPPRVLRPPPIHLQPPPPHTLRICSVYPPDAPRAAPRGAAGDLGWTGWSALAGHLRLLLRLEDFANLVLRLRGGSADGGGGGGKAHMGEKRCASRGEGGRWQGTQQPTVEDQPHKDRSSGWVLRRRPPPLPTATLPAVGVPPPQKGVYPRRHSPRRCATPTKWGAPPAPRSPHAS